MPPPIARALTSRNTRSDADTETLVAHTLRASGFDGSEDGSGRGTPLVFAPELADPVCANEARTYTHEGKGNFRVRNVVAINLRGRDGGSAAEMSDVASVRAASGGASRSFVAVAIQEDKQNGVSVSDIAGSVRSDAPGSQPCGTLVGQFHDAGMAVRRLTPLECERLQGYPDGWTLVPYRGKLAKDAPRYKAIGNGIALPCLAWIGRRIAMVDELVSSPPRPARRSRSSGGGTVDDVPTYGESPVSEIKPSAAGEES